MGVVILFIKSLQQQKLTQGHASVARDPADCVSVKCVWSLWVLQDQRPGLDFFEKHRWVSEEPLVDILKQRPSKKSQDVQWKKS